MTTIDQVVAIAAKYWADLLRSGTCASVLRDAGWDDDSSDSLVQGLITDRLTTGILSHATLITSEQCDAFERELTTGIKALLDGWKNYPGEHYRPNDGEFVGTDYHPCSTLTDAAKRAGIDLRKTAFDVRFPLKTCMYVGRDHVSVSEGYRASDRYLFQTKRHQIANALNERRWKYTNRFRSDETEAALNDLANRRNEASRNRNETEVAKLQNQMDAIRKPVRNRIQNIEDTLTKIFDGLEEDPSESVDALAEAAWAAVVLHDTAFLAETGLLSTEVLETM